MAMEPKQFTFLRTKMAYERPQERSRFCWYAGDMEFLPRKEPEGKDAPEEKKKKKIIMRAEKKPEG